MEKIELPTYLILLAASSIAASISEACLFIPAAAAEAAAWEEEADISSGRR